MDYVFNKWIKVKSGMNVKIENSEFVERLLKVSRTTKVVKGGRQFSFSALVAVGNRNGKIGIGRGKSRDTSTAIIKAIREAKKKSFFIKLNSFSSIPYFVKFKYGVSTVIMLPARDGTGIVAGNIMRAVFEVVGIKNVCSKVIGSKKNSNNIVLAMLECFKKFPNTVEVLEKIY